jgi:murein DD-endopeptidase MepM/ murein hydrolase activator NlpD
VTSRRTLAVTIAVLGLATAPAEAQSPEVAALQVALQAKGLYAGPVDGLAGPGTASAVRAVQSRSGLAVDGVAGPATRGALGRMGRPPLGSRVLRAPAVGWDAAILQFMLATRGFPSGPFDGALGPRTTSALVRFQGSRGLAADGIAGPGTIGALRGGAVARVPISLRRPVAAPVTDRFGPRNGGMHTGIDMPAPTGTPVRAAAAGCVAFAGWEAGYGTIISLRHGPTLTTLYAHLSQAGVAKGQCVAAGQVIGAVGATGRASGPHLHFEARVDGAAVDPLPYLI